MIDIDDEKNPRSWSPEEKVRAVFEASSLSDDDLGEFLRKKGLHEAQLEEWRTAALAALGEAKPQRGAAASERKRIKELERELNRKDKALAEVTAILALKKRVREIWGDEDDDTPTTSGT